MGGCVCVCVCARARVHARDRQTHRQRHTDTQRDREFIVEERMCVREMKERERVRGARMGS